MWLAQKIFQELLLNTPEIRTVPQLSKHRVDVNMISLI